MNNGTETGRGWRWMRRDRTAQLSADRNGTFPNQPTPTPEHLASDGAFFLFVCLFVCLFGFRLLFLFPVQRDIGVHSRGGI